MNETILETGRDNLQDSSAVAQTQISMVQIVGLSLRRIFQKFWEIDGKKTAKGTGSPMMTGEYCNLSFNEKYALETY